MGYKVGIVVNTVVAGRVNIQLQVVQIVSYIYVYYLNMPTSFALINTNG